MRGAEKTWKEKLGGSGRKWRKETRRKRERTENKEENKGGGRKLDCSLKISGVKSQQLTFSPGSGPCSGCPRVIQCRVIHLFTYTANSCLAPWHRNSAMNKTLSLSSRISLKILRKQGWPIIREHTTNKDGYLSPGLSIPWEKFSSLAGFLPIFLDTKWNMQLLGAGLWLEPVEFSQQPRKFPCAFSQEISPPRQQPLRGFSPRVSCAGSGTSHV